MGPFKGYVMHCGVSYFPEKLLQGCMVQCYYHYEEVNACQFRKKNDKLRIKRYTGARFNVITFTRLLILQIKTLSNT